MTSKISKIFICLILICAILGCQRISRIINNSGTNFTIKIETAEPNKEEIVQQAVKVITTRIDAIGLDGEVTQTPNQPNQISVKIFGSNDLEPIKKFLFTTYQLELKKVVSTPNPAPVQTYPTKEEAEKSANNEQEVLPYLDRLESPLTKFVIVEKSAIVNGSDVRTAQAVESNFSPNNYQIQFSLKKDGAEKFGNWTGQNINNYLAVVLDKKVQSIAFIKSQIFDTGQIDGSFTKQAAEDLALSLSSGYLPAKLTVIEEKPFGN